MATAPKYNMEVKFTTMYRNSQKMAMIVRTAGLYRFGNAGGQAACHVAAAEFVYVFHGCSPCGKAASSCISASVFSASAASSRPSISALTPASAAGAASQCRRNTASVRPSTPALSLQGPSAMA